MQTLKDKIECLVKTNFDKYENYVRKLVIEASKKDKVISNFKLISDIYDEQIMNDKIKKFLDDFNNNIIFKINEIDDDQLIILINIQYWNSIDDYITLVLDKYYYIRDQDEDFSYFKERKQNYEKELNKIKKIVEEILIRLAKIRNNKQYEYFFYIFEEYFNLIKFKDNKYELI